MPDKQSITKLLVGYALLSDYQATRKKKVRNIVRMAEKFMTRKKLRSGNVEIQKYNKIKKERKQIIANVGVVFFKKTTGFLEQIFQYCKI